MILVVLLATTLGVCTVAALKIVPLSIKYNIWTENAD